MNNHKALAILFTVITVGAIKESYRIFTSNAPDIAANRQELIIVAIVMTTLFLFLSIRYWQKVQKEPKL